VARVGFVERVEGGPGEQLAQQARGLAGLAEVEVDLGRAEPGLGVVGIGLTPAVVGVERALGLVLFARQHRLHLEDRRVGGVQVARRAQGPPHGAQVAVLQCVPGVVEEALQFGVQTSVVVHGATVPRRTLPAQRVPSRSGMPPRADGAGFAALV